MYFPLLARLANLMNSSSKITEIWCVIEAIFYVTIKLQVYYLQTRDPLEASLSAAPMLDPVDRKKLWDRMVDAEKDDPVTFLSGWFFDQPIENISRYDVFDFICWSMFDGRNQEHLTLEEEKNLEEFVDEMELVISLHLYGAADDEDDEIKDNNGSGASSGSDDRKEEDSVSDVISELTNENDENTYRHNKNPTNLQTEKPLVQKGGNRSVPDSNNSNDSKPEPAETELAARKKYARPKKSELTISGLSKPTINANVLPFYQCFAFRSKRNMCNQISFRTFMKVTRIGTKSTETWLSVLSFILYRTFGT